VLRASEGFTCSTYWFVCAVLPSLKLNIQSIAQPDVKMSRYTFAFYLLFFDITVDIVFYSQVIIYIHN